jgi:hypothetical protein
LFIPSAKVGIELNGLFWHSEKGSSGKCHSRYHLSKTELCKSKGVNLIHIFEDEWIERKEVVKSILRAKLGLIRNRIVAKLCVVKEVSKKDTLNFLTANHLHAPLVGKYNYGLYFENELVYLISLGQSRFDKNYQYEILRSCSKINIIVVGGFSKLIAHIVSELKPLSLISYVDRRYFEGNSYQGWSFLKKTYPNYFYTKNYKVRESRLKYQKHKLKKIFPDFFDKNLTEWQIMQLAGYDRIWDCGNLVYKL